jgi:hypothetical protein
MDQYSFLAESLKRDACEKDRTYHITFDAHLKTLFSNSKPYEAPWGVG